MSEKIAPLDRAELGPFDSSEVGLLTPYLDFGSLRVAPRADMAIRAEIEEANKRVVALTLEIEGQKLQLQAFAATKTAGLWADAMAQMEAGIVASGGTASQISGALGPELQVSAPVLVDGKQEFRESRFLGVDGPRWFLRGALIGPELYSEAKYLSLIEVFRSIVVHRGNVPLPPNELLPLQLPKPSE